MARDGADESDVADCTMGGVEIEIRRNGGVPPFNALVDLGVTAASSFNRLQLLAGADAISKGFADYPLTRDYADAAVRVGLAAIANGISMTRRQAAEAILVEIGAAHWDGMAGYLTRNRTGSLSESQRIVESIKSHLPHTAAAPDLAARMLNGSPKGFPARPAKCAPVSHTVEGLAEEL